VLSHPTSIVPSDLSSIDPAVLLTAVVFRKGIGAACALAVAEAGASVCVVVREPKDGTPPNLITVNAIRALGAKVEYIFCDLSDLHAVKGLFKKALDAMGGQIHVLVNCAGIQRRSPSVDFSESDWDNVRFFFHSRRTPFIFLLSCWRSLTCTSHPLASIRLTRHIPPALGFRRQPQVCVAALASRWSAYGTSETWQDHQLLLPLVLSRRCQCSRLRLRQRCFDAAYQGTK